MSNRSDFDQLSAEEISHLVLESRHEDLSFDAWRALAFRVIAMDDSQLLDCLLDRRLIPVHIQNDDGQNILQAAVAQQSAEIVEYILDGDMHGDALAHSDMTLLLVKGPVTALELAIQREDSIDISDVLLQRISEVLLSTESADMLNRAIGMAATEHQRYNTRITLRQMQIKELFCRGSRKSIDELKTEADSYPWYPEQLDELTDYEKWEIYNFGLRSYCSDALVHHVHWIIHDWKLPLVPAGILRLPKLSLGDYAALGSHTLHLDANENNHAYDPQNSHEFFQTGLFHRWDGMTETYMKSFENLFNSKGIFEERKHHNPFYLAILPVELTENRLATLSTILSSCTSSNICFTYPHLDLLVKADQYLILEWLVENNYLDLSLQLHHRTHASTAEQPAPIEIDDVCNICLEDFKDPRKLDCGHYFCRICLYRYAGSISQTFLSEINCPKCRQRSSYEHVNSATTYHEILADRMSSYLSHIDIEELNCTVGEALMVLSAGLGSIQTLDWLINKKDVNAEVLFSQNKNLMHIAASKGEWRSIKWLLVNGYSTMALHVDDNMEMPPEIACKNMGTGAAFAMECFLKTETIIPNWFEKALASSNSAIVQYALEFKTMKIIENLPRQIGEGISVDEFRNVFFTSFRTVMLATIDLMDEIIRETLLHNRVDLIYFFLGTKECFKNVPMYTRIKDFKRVFESLDKKHQEVQSALQFFESIAKLISDFYDAQKKLQDICEDKNGAVSELKNAIKEEEQCFLLVPSEYRFRIRRFSFSSILTRGLDALEYAIENGNFEIARWLLDNDEIYPRSKKPYGTLRVAIQNLCYEGVKVVCEWMKAKDLGFNFSFLKDRSEEQSVGYTPLDHVISMIPMSIGALKFGGNVNGETCMDIFRYLCKECNIHHSSMNEPPLQKLVSRMYLFGCETESDYQKFDRGIAETVKTLVELGVDWRERDENGKTFIEKVLEEGAPGYMSAIEFLVREKGAEIRYQVFKTDRYFSKKYPFIQLDEAKFLELQRQFS